MKGTMASSLSSPNLAVTLNVTVDRPGSRSSSVASSFIVVDSHVAESVSDFSHSDGASGSFTVISGLAISSVADMSDVAGECEMEERDLQVSTLVPSVVSGPNIAAGSVFSGASHTVSRFTGGKILIKL